MATASLEALRAPAVLSPLLRLPAPRILPRTIYRATNHLRPLLTSFLLPAFSLKLPPLLSGLWESILRAVPKKRTSHRKKRQRFLAGKALKDVTALVRCSACGNMKRSHMLCPYCVRGWFEHKAVLGVSAANDEQKSGICG